MPCAWTAICRKGPSFTVTRFPLLLLRRPSWLRLSVIAWSGSGILCFRFIDWPPTRDTARLIISRPCASMGHLLYTANRSLRFGMLPYRRRCWHSCWERTPKNPFENLRNRRSRAGTSENQPARFLRYNRCMALRLMVFTAHPDDEAGSFGGSLRLYSERKVQT